MAKPRRPTLEDIARQARVSRATASRALRNHPGLPPETCQRVQQIAQRLGYQANPLVSTVMANVRHGGSQAFMGVLGYITADPSRGGWRRVDTFRRYHAGAVERARQYGYQIEEFWLKETGMTGRRMSGILHTRGIQGLLIAPLPLTPSHGHLSLEWPRFSAVALGNSLWRPSLDRVATDSYRSARLVLRMLRRRGYRRVGLFMPSHVDERADESCLAAFLVHQRRFGAADFPMLFTLDPTPEALERLVRKQRPEVVVSVVVETLGWLRELGYKVPEEIGFVHLDLTRADGRCAGIDQRSESLGGAAVDLLMTQLQRNESGVPALPRRVLLEGVWVEGETVRRQRPAGELPKRSRGAP
jgi:LacI family transcriptional regulator